MEKNIKRHGLIAGISLIIMAIVAGIAFGYAHKSMVSELPETTWTNISSNKSLFYIEIVSWIIIFMADIIVSISLYHFFKDVNSRISGITAAIRIIYSLILGYAIFHLFKILPLLGEQSDSYLSSNIAQSASYFKAFEVFWSWGLVIFGLHLLGLGYLAYTSNRVNKIIAVLLLIGGLGYSFIHLSRRLELIKVETINAAEGILTLPMALSEILLAFWLIFFSLKRKKVAA
ncbi:MAG: DUF4386 domain-containing protein [Bacteroidetes bacterium]|nr:DUF4386 domain-containing protein [Bacteroidota bacterium]